MIQEFLLALGTLFPIVNPLGTTFIFSSMTKAFSFEERKSLAFKASVVSFVTLVVFMFMGPYILSFFGVSIYAFRVAGGIYLVRVAMGMLGQQLWKSAEDYEASKEVAVVPLAIPLLAGPGSMTSVLAITAADNSTVIYGGTALALLSIFFVSYWLFRYSVKISDVLGSSGSKITERVFGLIVLVIAAEFLFSGLTGYLEEIGFI